MVEDPAKILREQARIEPNNIGRARPALGSPGQMRLKTQILRVISRRFSKGPPHHIRVTRHSGSIRAILYRSSLSPDSHPRPVD
jgi:hypothetical protein